VCSAISFYSINFHFTWLIQDYTTIRILCHFTLFATLSRDTTESLNASNANQIRAISVKLNNFQARVRFSSVFPTAPYDCVVRVNSSTVTLQAPAADIDWRPLVVSELNAYDRWYYSPLRYTPRDSRTEMLRLRELTSVTVYSSGDSQQQQQQQQQPVLGLIDALIQKLVGCHISTASLIVCASIAWLPIKHVEYTSHLRIGRNALGSFQVTDIKQAVKLLNGNQLPLLWKNSVVNLFLYDNVFRHKFGN